MIIKCCSKPRAQQFNAVTPTPLAHRSHSCMRALALDYDNRCGSFQLGSYVDSHGQSFPLDMEVTNVYYVPQNTMNILSTTNLKQYNMFFTSQYGSDVLVIPGLPTQVSGVLGSWHQTYGKDGYPIIYLYLGELKPLLRTNCVDDGNT